MRRASVIVLLIAVLVAVYFAVQHHRNTMSVSVAAGAPATESKIENQKSKIRGDGLSSAERSHLADDLNASSSDIHHDLQVVADVLAAFRSNFPHDGNPWGDNVEITAQLTGRNKLHLALIPRDHPAINAAGQLCDRWGTPFFFHAESGTRMAVRSAGPDRKMWTADDVDLEP
jgi:hypothetical protein